MMKQRPKATPVIKFTHPAGNTLLGERCASKSHPDWPAAAASAR
jgi:hypothetical protein